MTAEAQLAVMRAALEFLVADQCDYMIRNNLGDPEQQHGIKMARQALATDGKAAADVLAAARNCVTAFDNWRAKKGSWDALLGEIGKLRDADSAFRNEGRNDG